MEDSLSSAERPRSLKTYAGRAKKRRNSVVDSNNDASDESDSENSGSNGHKSASLSKSPVFKRTPKKVEGHLPGPGPSLKRSRSDIEDTSMKPPSGKAAEDFHTRNSSVTSIRLDQISTSSPSTKPVSSTAVKHARSQSLKSLGSLQLQYDTFSTPLLSSLDRRPITSFYSDEASSVDESCPDPVIRRRTEAQRIEVIQSYSVCGEMEPYRVFCTRCDQWVNLGKKQTYTVKPWEKHRIRCDQKEPGEPWRRPIKAKAGENGHNDDDEDDGTSVVASSVAKSEKIIRRTEPERLAFLEADVNAETIETDRVLCKICHVWIKLSDKQKYDLTHWKTHQRRCTGAVPSSRVATAERKIKLVNDSQAKSFSARSVECASCGEFVPLGNEGDYNLSKWIEHKTHCQSTPARHVAAIVPSRPPLSVASTEATAVASDRGLPKQGQKRARETEGQDDAQRPWNRPRTENYEPVQKDAPGPWGWFLVPFRAFMRGFREGMEGSPS